MQDFFLIVFSIFFSLLHVCIRAHVMCFYIVERRRKSTIYFDTFSHGLARGYIL